MRLAFAVTAMLLLLLAGPAQAQFAGPSIDGDRVVWGADEGTSAKLLERRDGKTRTLWRSRFPADPYDHPRGVAASSGWTAISIAGFDRKDQVVAARPGGRFREVLPGAAGPVAAEGDGLVLARKGSVHLIEGRAAPRRMFRVPPGETLVDVDITPVYIAVATNARLTIVVRDQGDVLRRLGPGYFGGRFFLSFDLDDIGYVAAQTATPTNRRVAIRGYTGGELVTLRRGGSFVATEAERVAYFADRRLVLATGEGEVIRRFGNLDPSDEPFHVALSADRIAWLTSAGRLHTEPLPPLE